MDVAGVVLPVGTVEMVAEIFVKFAAGVETIARLYLKTYECSDVYVGGVAVEAAATVLYLVQEWRPDGLALVSGPESD